jgi:hypothetical protein
MDNICRHYQNHHGECAPESRCWTDPNYDPSKIIIQDETALSLLQKALGFNTVVYKHAQDGHVLYQKFQQRSEYLSGAE